MQKVYLQIFDFIYLSKEVNEALDIMQQFTRAVFYRFIKTKDGNNEEQHQYCPKTSDTWCFYHQQKISSNGNDTSIRKKNDRSLLHPIFRDILQPLIDKLTSRELLRRYLCGISQNSNESLNSLVWQTYTSVLLDFLSNYILLFSFTSFTGVY